MTLVVARARLAPVTPKPVQVVLFQAEVEPDVNPAVRIHFIAQEALGKTQLALAALEDK